MKDVEKKKNGWRWLLSAIIIVVLLFLGLLYAKLHGTPSVALEQTPPFVQATVQQGKLFVYNLGNVLQTKLVAVNQQAQQYPLGSTVSQLSTNLGIGGYTFTLLSILFVMITLPALIAGWYIRRFGKKKWLGYLLSIIGFLPLLPIMLAGSLVYWFGKLYWKSGKVTSKKAAAPKEPTIAEGPSRSNLIDDWEKSFNRLEKVQS